VTSSPRYEIVGSSKFEADLRLLRSQARADPARHGYLYREVLREIEKLRHGLTDGHHVLGYEAGKGDLRDCVTSYVQSHPRAKADHRLVFREMGPAAPDRLPRRELLAIRPRQGSGDIYEHTCARLNRHPDDMQPGLDRFGRRPASSGGNQAERQAVLDAKRAIAHAWAGQQPLATSKPLGLSQFGQRGTTSTPEPGRSRDR
jgi:hypothetical protein